MRRRGFTLIELVVYTGLFAMAGLLIAQIFSLMTSTQRGTASAYAVTGQVDTALHWLRRDLEETVLGTVRGYSTGTPGPLLSMISARTIDPKDGGQLLISEYGGLRWNKHIFYAVKPRTALTGDLVRWEVPLSVTESNRLPQVAERPTSIPGNARVIVHDVMLPNKTVQGLNGGAGLTTDAWGGFRTQFVRRAGGDKGAESLSSTNPALNKTGTDNTRLVEVQFDVKEDNVGAPNYYSIKFRVMPRN